MGLTACSKDDDYTPGAPVDGAQVYFPQSTATTYNISEAQDSFTIMVNRATDKEAVTVPVTVTVQTSDEVVDFSDAFDFPSSITFAAGEKTAEYIVTYDISQLVDDDGEAKYGDEQQFLIQIDDAAKTPYGVSSLSITVVYPEPWTMLGEGKYYDKYWGVIDTEDEDEYAGPISITVEQNDVNKNRFRIQNPYREWNGEETYFEFYITVAGGTYFGQEVDKAGLVVYNDYFVEYNPKYDDDVYLVFPGRFTDYADPSYWVYNRVVSYQENGLPAEIHLSPFYYMFNNGGWNHTTDEPITIVFPGVVLLDTSIEVSYEGMLNKTDNSLEAVAYVTLGEDAEMAKVALISGSSVTNDVLAGIQDGTIESVSIEASGTVNLPFDSANPSGKYTIVALSYLDGEAVDYAYATFSYTAGTPETWSLVCEGTYTYLEFWVTNLGIEPEVLELYESDSTPGKYKITHWLGDQDFLFTLDDDGSILVEEEQPTGITAGGVEIWVDDASLWGVPDPSVLEDGIYYFSLVYYNPVSGGYYAYGYETFEPVDATRAATRGMHNSAQKNFTKKFNKRATFSSIIKKPGFGLNFLELASDAKLK